MTPAARSAQRAASWPSGWALALWAWLAIWRVADIGDNDSVAPLVGLLADLCAVVGSFALHRAWSSAWVRVGFGAAGLAMGLARGLGALSQATTGRPLNEAFVDVMFDNVDWFWGARWLLLAAMLTGPLWATVLRRDAALASGSIVRAGLEPETIGAGQRALAAAAWVLWAVAQVALGLGAGSGAEVRVVAALLR